MATDYYTAYRGIATGADGSFNHFVRHLDPFHLQHGYWRFHSVDDDRRAMASGFTTPEAVLSAAENDTSSDQLDQIVLCWVRGVNDPHSGKVLSASASQHLQTIYQLRNLLGLPMSSRCLIPLHPVNDDVRLKEYWERRFSASLSRPAQDKPSTTASPQNSGTGVTQHDWVHIAPRGSPSGASSNIGRTDGTAQHQQHSVSQGPVHSSPGFFSPNAQVTNNAAARPLPPTTPERGGRTIASIGATKQNADGMPTGDRTVDGSHQGSPDSALFQEKLSTVSSADIYDTTQYTTPKADPVQAEGVILAPSPNVPPRRSTLSLSGRVEAGEMSPKTPRKSIRAGGSPQVPSASQCDNLEHSNKLPCMDCGEEDGHKYDCNIGNIMPMMNPTVLDYRDFIDAADQFDPGPYTSHFDQHPNVEPEDPQTQIGGMADVIRNEDSFKEDAELHRLPDDLMILLWAFKTSNGVRLNNEDEWA